MIVARNIQFLILIIGAASATDTDNDSDNESNTQVPPEENADDMINIEGNERRNLLRDIGDLLPRILGNQVRERSELSNSEQSLRDGRMQLHSEDPDLRRNIIQPENGDDLPRSTYFFPNIRSRVLSSYEDPRLQRLVNYGNQNLIARPSIMQRYEDPYLLNALLLNRYRYPMTGLLQPRHVHQYNDVNSMSMQRRLRKLNYQFGRANLERSNDDY